MKRISKKKNKCMMHGPVVLSNKEESSTLLQWKPNYQVTINLTIHQKSSYWTNKKKKNGKNLINKTDHLTLFLELSLKWDTFLFMTGSFNKDSKDVWICIYVQESRRKNLTLILILWSLSYQIQKHWNHSPPQSISPTTVTQALLTHLLSLQADNTYAQGTKAVWL